MRINFVLKTGRVISATMPDFDSNKFSAELNNPQLRFVNIGTNGFHVDNLLEWYESPVVE